MKIFVKLNFHNYQFKKLKKILYNNYTKLNLIKVMTTICHKAEIKTRINDNNKINIVIIDMFIGDASKIKKFTIHINSLISSDKIIKVTDVSCQSMNDDDDNLDFINTDVFINEVSNNVLIIVNFTGMYSGEIEDLGQVEGLVYVKI